MTPDQVHDTIYIVGTKLNGPILKYNGVTGAFIGTFAGGVTGFNTGELLWLNGNNLAAAYYSNTAGTDGFIRIYDCDDGSILQTITLVNQGDPTSLGTRAQIHLSDPFPNFNPQLTLHVWYKFTSCKSRFITITIATGGISGSFDRDNFFSGLYQCDAQNPNERFGHSASCNFYTLVEEIPALIPGETGTIIVIKETVGGDTEEFDFTVTGDGLTPFSLSDGEDITFDDLVPNSGYGVTETEEAGFVVSYNVSNGSPHDNITVGPSETVTVTVTNTPTGRITVQKVTAGVISAIKFTFTLSGNGIPTSTVELANGETHTFENIPIGTGYTISETQLAPGWEITSVLIDGAPGELTEIDVAQDVETLVIVTNTFTPFAGGGIYKIQPGKTDDTLWISVDEDEKFARKIPDPTAITALFGD
jgi:hypothetical protein